MELRDLKDFEELRACVNLAIDQHYDPLFPPDYNAGFSKMFHSVKRGCLFKTIYHEDQLVGWGSAHVTNSQFHCTEPEVTLLYYQTTLKGFIAVKALKAFHQEMIKFARGKKVSKCCSSSMMASQETFYRILEQEGWIRRGALMVYLLDNRNSDILGLGWRGSLQGKTQRSTRLATVRSLREARMEASPRPCVSPGASMQDSGGQGEAQHLMNYKD